jgi:hypothetical protein
MFEKLTIHSINQLFTQSAIMKKIFLSVTAILLSVYCMAQENIAFPFQGGKDIMKTFFRDSLTVSPEIGLKKATGLVVFKFTADDKGRVTKMVIYYADDPILVSPVIEALKKSSHKWIIPDHEKFHDFIIPFAFSFTPPALIGRTLQKAVYDYNTNRKPIFSSDQIPLDMATLLPTVMIKYALKP